MLFQSINYNEENKNIEIDGNENKKNEKPSNQPFAIRLILVIGDFQEH
jgi:hypothetical protein